MTKPRVFCIIYLDWEMIGMRLRFKSALMVILILFVFCVAIGIGYIFYTKITDDAVVVAYGNVTVNYLNGNEFKLTKDGKLQFSVTNNGSSSAFYYIQLLDIKGSSSAITYKIKNENDDIIASDNLKSEVVSNNIVLEEKQTATYTIEFSSDSDEEYSGKLVVGINQKENITFSETIIADNVINEVPLSNLGDNSTMEEGLIAGTDDLGKNYYFRGKVENNYVKFADFTWRIVKINGDGSVKLVLDNVTDVLSKYYEEEIGFKESAIISGLNSWYNLYLNNYSDYIANYKFCNDTIYNNDTNSFIAYDRIIINKIPTFECLGTFTNNKIGLLTADEVVLAGGSHKDNSAYYLYNGSIKTEYYTMTSAKRDDNSYYPFVVSAEGALNYSTKGNLLRAVRPVINIIRNANVIGDGTKDNPYIINIEKN